MSLPQPSLPEGWIERLWAQMRATYGASFDRQWDCPAGVEPAVHVASIKAHWARELGCYLHNPDAIRYGLDHLPPDYPPNLLQFRAACNRRPEPALPALPAPKADPGRVAEVVRRAKESQAAQVNARAWIGALAAREKAGLRLTAAQRDMLRDAQRMTKVADAPDLDEARAA